MDSVNKQICDGVAWFSLLQFEEHTFLSAIYLELKIPLPVHFFPLVHFFPPGHQYADADPW